MHYSLVLDHAEVLRPSDLLILLLYGLGSTAIPSVVLQNVRLPQRRWNSAGEIEHTSALEFGILPEMVSFLEDDDVLAIALDSPDLVKHTDGDDIVLWSITPEMKASLDGSLIPAAAEYLGKTAMKLMCFICPPCLEGNLDWYVFFRRFC